MAHVEERFKEEDQRFHPMKAAIRQQE